MEVKTSDDLSHARVYVSYFGDKKLEDETFMALENCTGHMRNLLKQRVKMRVVPYLRIIKDESLDNAMQLTGLIDEAMSKTHETEKNYIGEEDGTSGSK